MPPTSLVREAHAAGLFVHVWTMRSEGVFLSSSYGADPRREYEQFASLDVDGFFTDFRRRGGHFLSMRVRRTVTMAPATVTAVVMVESDGESRALEVVAESEEFFRSSQVELDGADARRVNTFEFRDLRSGVYQVTAVWRAQMDGSSPSRIHLKSRGASDRR